MPTSGQTSFNLTSNEIIASAFNVLGIAMEGEALTAEMYTHGRRNLNLLIKSWGAHPRLWIKTEGTFAMVASQAAYNLTPRALRVLSVRRRLNNIDTPMNELSRQEYFDQPNKTESPTIPVSFYFDPQTTTGTLYLWPAPSAQAVSQYTIRYTYIRRMDDMVSTNDDLDMPQEWLEPVIWNLAKRLITQYPVNDPNLVQLIIGQAQEYYNNLLAWDNEPASLYMAVDYNAWPCDA